MQAAGVPTARQLAVARTPCVVKADGLAAGKGVFVCATEDELDAALLGVNALGGGFVVEELLEGAEVSLFALCDGADAVPLPVAQDFKRAFDGDAGPNTGGMGSYAPVPGIGEAEVEDLLETVCRPVLHELHRRGSPFVGVLFAGLMLTAGGPRVLEFNCRFGDPETQSVVPLLSGDLTETLAAAAVGELHGVTVESSEDAAVSVVLAAEGYPERSDRGSTIEGVADALELGALVFHAGTARHGDRLVTNGGRIVTVTARGDTLAAARELAYRAASRIAFDGKRSRSDIAQAAADGEVVTLRS
jgi:phosphoribosylamine--glycine ligase